MGDIDTVAIGNDPVQDLAIEAEIVAVTRIEAGDPALIVIVEETGHPQEIAHPEENDREADQEVDLVLDQGLLESVLKIPKKRPKKMDEIVRKLLIKKPIMRIFLTLQGLRSTKRPKNQRR